MKVNILGTQYEIFKCSEAEDALLANMDGYCDKTTKRIVVTKKTADCDLGDWEVYQKKIMRHEIIHAFLFESGLHENWQHCSEYGHDETTVDWIAVQFPKLQKAFEEAGCL